MPRRALWGLTALVLALHWLVLAGLPRAWEPVPAAPRHAAARAFNTRSVAPPPPPPPPPALAPQAPPAAAQPPTPPRPRPRPRPAPAPAPAPAVAEQPAAVLPAAPAEPPPAPAQAEPEPEPAPGDVALPAPDAAASAGADPGASAPAAEEAATAEPPPAPATAAAPAGAPPAADAPAPAAPAPPAATAAGIDIAAPGTPADSAPATSAPAAAPPPVRLPPPLRLAFEVNGQARKFTYNARAELLWQHDGSRYQARQEVSAFLMGSRAQRSTGTLGAQGLVPQRFGDKSRSERAAHFDHARGRATFSANTPEAAIGPGAQDRLSVFIQLGALLAADPARFVPGTQITLTTVSASSADRWTFTVEGPQTLELPAGALATLKLQRLPRKQYDQKAELWVAPSLGYLPVRIQLTQANGDFADLRLSSSSPP